MRKLISSALVATLLASAGPSLGQEEAPRSPAPVSGYPKPVTFANEDHAKAADYLARARAIAGSDLYGDFVHRCISDARYRQRVNALQFNGLLGPAKVFDQLYFVGQNAVSAWALDTADGIVLFDALNSAEEAREIIVPGLAKLGLDPKRLRYVVITHSHGDHYGGADWLRKQYGAKLVSSAEDWAVMDQMRTSGRTVGPFALPPTRDIAVADGQVMTVGTTRLHFFVTPGHTPGTLSTIFDVSDKGVRHTVAFFGGFGAPRDPRVRYQMIGSIERFAKAAAAANADTLIANHPVQDGAFEKLELLGYRRPGDANPFVVGGDKLQRYYRLQVACSRLGLVRAGLDPERPVS